MFEKLQGIIQIDLLRVKLRDFRFSVQYLGEYKYISFNESLFDSLRQANDLYVLLVSKVSFLSERKV